MTLYEIEKALLECIDSETGEIMDFNRLDELQLARDTKIENIALYIKNLIAEADAIKNEENTLKARRQAKEKRAESLKEYLAKALDGSNFESSKVNIGFRKSEKVDITAEADLVFWLEENRQENCLEYSLPKVVKAEVKKLLKEGVKIPYAVLQENNNIQIK